MPRCKDCSFFQADACTAHSRAAKEYGRPIPPPPIGACTLAIVDSYRPLIKRGMRVLEIGCGTWTLLKSICDEAGAEYQSIDSQNEYFGKPSIATRIENLQQLSFEDDAFDLVIGNQTIEHWAEFDCDTQFGLFQCFRVCRQNGMVIMNAPIHFHGSRPFLLGDFDAIRALFSRYSDSVVIEAWGEDSDPIPKFYTYRKYGALKGKHAFIIDIRAVKSKPVGQPPMVVAMPMKLRRWLNYPASYLAYRALVKCRLIAESNISA